MIRTVIFDIDNTLYSFTEANRFAMDALRSYAEEKFGWTAERFDRLHKEARDEIFARLGYVSGFRARIIRYHNMLEKAHLPLSPHAQAMTELYWKTLLAHMQLSDGAADLMAALRAAGFRIGIGTDMTAYMQFVKLEHLGLLPYVDFVVTSEEAGAEKPAQGLFSLCASKAGCAPEECLFIGDDLEKDILGSIGAGMQALWYNPNQESCPQGIREIASLRDAAGILLAGHKKTGADVV